jgi:hypothetical protein
VVGEESYYECVGSFPEGTNCVKYSGKDNIFVPTNNCFYVAPWTTNNYVVSYDIGSFVRSILRVEGINPGYTPGVTNSYDARLVDWSRANNPRWRYVDNSSGETSPWSGFSNVDVIYVVEVKTPENPWREIYYRALKEDTVRYFPELPEQMGIVICPPIYFSDDPRYRNCISQFEFEKILKDMIVDVAREYPQPQPQPREVEFIVHTYESDMYMRPGTYTLQFSAVPGYIKPPDQTITLSAVENFRFYLFAEYTK